MNAWNFIYNTHYQRAMKKGVSEDIAKAVARQLADKWKGDFEAFAKVQVALALLEADKLYFDNTTDEDLPQC